MVSITVPLERDLKERMEKLSWVNWSEVGRRAVYKKYLFEKYLAKKRFTSEENEFCEKIDWHPVDELPLKKDFIQKISGRKRETSLKINKISDLFE